MDASSLIVLDPALLLDDVNRQELNNNSEIAVYCNERSDQLLESCVDSYTDFSNKPIDLVCYIFIL